MTEKSAPPNLSGVAEASAAFERPARAKLFKHGGSQAVRLPKAFRFEGDEVNIRREGHRVILEPVVGHRPPKTDEEWAAFWARIDARRDPNDPFPYPPPQAEWPDPQTW